MKKAGKKPKDVKEASSALKRLQAFDKSRVAAGKPAIFDVNKKKEEPKKPVKESYDSEEAAKKRLRQIEFFKRQG
jgi:hypothetical protein